MDPACAVYAAARGIPEADVAAIPTLPRYVRTTAAGEAAAFTAEVDGETGKPTVNFADRVKAELTAEVSDASEGTPDDITVTAVPWLPSGYFAVTPRTAPLASTPLHRAGAVVGMDASSVATLVALAPRPNDSVLDVCCAPGMKLAALGEACASVAGVDISLDRLFVCRAVLRKLRVPPTTRLFLADATEFTTAAAIAAEDSDTVEAARSKRELSSHAPPPPDVDSATIMSPAAVALWRADGSRTEGFRDVQGQSRRDRRLLAIGKTLKEAKRPRGDEETEKDREPSTNEAMQRHAAAVRSLGGPVIVDSPVAAPALSTTPSGEASLVPAPPLRTPSGGFDCVLVDAECTHDGSVAHLPSNGAGLNKGAATVAPSEQLRRLHTADDGLRSLQLRLLLQGVSNCRVGGTVVYSTCSFDTAQNEDIVFAALRSLGDSVSLVDPFEAALGDAVAARFRLSPERLDALRAVCDGGRSPEHDTGDAAQRAVVEAVRRHCVRLTPSKAGTSFQFIARLCRS